ncbi:MAG: hypothetical protein NTY23_08735, partial [Chloroflexi bacterium]|nr:hypothetical protein [Chloroflexota bacterium]
SVGQPEALAGHDDVVMTSKGFRLSDRNRCRTSAFNAPRRAIAGRDRVEAASGNRRRPASPEI